MPSSRHARMTRSAISPRHAIATHSNGGRHQSGSRRSRNAGDALAALVGCAAPGERLGRAYRLRRRVAVAQSRDQAPWLRAPPPARRAAARRAFARRRASRALSSACTSCTMPISRACRASKQLSREEERARLRPADARQRERPDRRRYQPESHLGEPEARVLAREHDVAAAGEPGPAAERGAVHPRDDGHRAAVDGREHGRRAFGVRHVAFVGELARCAHPVEVGPGAEGGAPSSQQHGAQAILGGERRERIVYGLDQLGVERVAALGTVEPHAHDGTVALDREAAHIRKTPKRGSGIGARAAAARPSASTRRVSRGSITPSSHRRALE